ncbi:MAG: hypothetical protein U0Q11_14325 [Vicinamibacterales bacterium]
MSGMPDDTPRQYLLRRLADADANAFEERLLSDDTCAEQLREAEDNLLVEYADAQLTPDERAAVERYLLSSAEGERRLRFARALAEAARQAGGTPGTATTSGASQSTSPSSSARRWLAPLGLLIAAGVAYFVLVLPRSHAPGPSSVSPEATPVASAPAPPQTPANAAAQAPAYAVLLLAEIQRGTSSAQRIAVPPGTTRLRLQLEVAADAPGSGEPLMYQMVVQDPNGQQVFAASSLSARQVGAYRIVEADVPVSELGTGARRVSLSRVTGSRLVPEFDWNVDVRPAAATP